MSHDRKRFTIFGQLAADPHELMMSQRTMRPSVAPVSEQLDPQFAASRHTTAPISVEKPGIGRNVYQRRLNNWCANF